tara:strand:+ start:2752 stop:3150 length:399 start_codon:yes stop_codon:yes gene_type:complete
MSDLKITGVITLIKEKQTGTSKTGSEWEKLEFVVTAEDGQYKNQYCFEIFGNENVAKFEQYNSLNQVVDVKFNIRTNEWTDPKTKVLKHFTSLSAWSVFAAETSDSQAPKNSNVPSAPVSSGQEDEENGLPF